MNINPSIAFTIMARTGLFGEGEMLTANTTFTGTQIWYARPGHLHFRLQVTQ